MSVTLRTVKAGVKVDDAPPCATYVEMSELGLALALGKAAAVKGEPLAAAMSDGTGETKSVE